MTEHVGYMASYSVTRVDGEIVSVNAGLSHGIEGYGEIEVNRLYEDGRWIVRLVRADPKVLVLHDILTNLNGTRSEWQGVGMRLDGMPLHCWHDGHDCSPACCSSPDDCYHGMLLHVDTADRHIVYRITEYLPDRKCWEATWPD